MSEAIRTSKVALRAGGREILSDVSLEVAEGEVLALLGPSGSGKTSLVRVILGFLAPDRGEVLLRGRAASADGRVRIPPEDRGLSVVFQDLALWPHLTVRQHLEFGLKAARIPRAERDARVSRWLARLELEGTESRHPGTLSGGERQRVAIARALVLDPLAVLLDEPLASLDVVLKRELLGVFREALQRAGTAALYVTHDPREAMALADRVAVLEAGRVVQAGSFADLRAAPATPFVAGLVAELTSRPFAPGGE